METHTGVPQRPPASAHLMVASTDRYANFFDRIISPTTAAKWNMNKSYNLLYGYFTRLAITQLNFEWNIPTIVPNGNDVFEITFETSNVQTTIAIQLDPGFYTGTELAAAIETGVTTDGNYSNSWNFTCDYIDGCFVFETAVTTEIAFTPIPDDAGNSINRLFQTLGINNNNIEFNDLQTTSVATLLYTRWVDITSSRLTQFQRVKDASTLPNNLTDNIIARVYASPPNVLVSPTSSVTPNFSNPWVMTIDYNTPKHIKWEVNQSINNFDIQVYDEFGELMFWSPEWATEYNFTFLASET